jgi:hypothetical protein
VRQRILEFEFLSRTIAAKQPMDDPAGAPARRETTSVSVRASIANHP